MPSIDPVTIDALLPQTQCTQCGFDGCLPYAAAIAAGEALVNRCAPGGDDGIHALADLTGRAYMPLDPAHGIHKPRVLAVIDEARCIGCTICIQKCPVDAIAGAAKLMHTVIADECTGCELCVAPCPVDCIALVPAPASHPALAAPEAAKAQARNRYRARLSRLATKAARRRNDAVSPVSAPALPILPAVPANAMACATPASGASFVPNIDEGRSTDNTQPAIGSPAHKRDAIAAALERARARRIASAGPR